MAEEWRVCLIFNDHSGARKKSYYRTTLRDLLRSRLGDAIAVSGADKMQIFLYAETADTAEWAERAAREVLAEQSLVADSRLERWDPSGLAWRDVKAGEQDCAVAGLPAAQEDKPVKRRLGAAANVLGNVVAGGVVDAVGDVLSN